MEDFLKSTFNYKIPRDVTEQQEDGKYDVYFKLAIYSMCECCVCMWCGAFLDYDNATCSLYFVVVSLSFVRKFLIFDRYVDKY